MKQTDTPDCIGKSCDKSVFATKEGKEELARGLESMLSGKYESTSFCFHPDKCLTLFILVFFFFFAIQV